MNKALEKRKLMFSGNVKWSNFLEYGRLMGEQTGIEGRLKRREWSTTITNV